MFQTLHWFWMTGGWTRWTERLLFDHGLTIVLLVTTHPSYEKGLDRDRHVSTSPWYMKQIVTIYYISSTSQYHISSFVEEFLGFAGGISIPWRRWGPLKMHCLLSLVFTERNFSWFFWISRVKFEILLVETSNITCNMQQFLHTRSCWIFLNTQVLTPWCKTMCLDVGNKKGDL